MIVICIALDGRSHEVMIAPPAEGCVPDQFTYLGRLFMFAGSFDEVTDRPEYLEYEEPNDTDHLFTEEEEARLWKNEPW